MNDMKENVEKMKMQLEEDIENIKTSLGVPRLTVVVDTEQLAAQISLGGEVTFLDALRSAIKSFQEDENDSASLVDLIELDPAAYSLPPSPDIAAVSEVIRGYMNHPNSKIILLHYNYQYLPEDGESVEENWIFRLEMPEFFSGNIMWAIVPRSGTKPAYNYDFS